jgi:hypothetical protein
MMGYPSTNSTSGLKRKRYISDVGMSAMNVPRRVKQSSGYHIEMRKLTPPGIPMNNELRSEGRRKMSKLTVTAHC